MKKTIILSFIFFLFIFPFAAWSAYKPIRILVPQWVSDVECINRNICMDNKVQYAIASRLSNEALKQVAGSVGKFKEKPKIILCSTESCFQSFSFDKATAMTIGNLGIVISPRGWKLHIIKHELIHYRQAEELGFFVAWSNPEWLVEGMAYSLSNDPRYKLSERWESGRTKFNSWYEKLENDDLWNAARKL